MRGIGGLLALLVLVPVLTGLAVFRGSLERVIRPLRDRQT